jgi:hypothetical protein
MLAGHIHTLEVLNYANGEAPLFIVGDGGDSLERRMPAPLAGLEVLGAKVADGFSLPGFGFAMLEAAAEGWSLGIYDSGGTLERRCRLARRRIDCPGA